MIAAKRNFLIGQSSIQADCIDESGLSNREMHYNLLTCFNPPAVIFRKRLVDGTRIAMPDQPKKPKPTVKPPSAQVTAMRPDDLSPPAPVMPLQAANKTIALGSMIGKYKVTAVLGSGRMGTVYAAVDSLIKRKVAIKVLPPELARDQSLIQRLLAEAQSAGRLNHPNVVTIFDVDQFNGSYYIVMELITGGSVQDYLARQGSPGWRAATRLIGEACKALSAAHETGLIHRDIKPSNLMLTQDGHVKVADFGLAKAESQDAAMATQPGAILGTPAFMSPEQCRGDKLDPRTDLYSLGCTYYAMLTGKPPFEAATSMQVMFAHCSAPVPDPRELAADVPIECVEIVSKSLAKNPNDRYASAKDMLNDLRAVLAGQTLASAMPIAALQVAANAAPVVDYHTPPRSNPIKGWMVLAGLALAAFVLVVMGMFFFAKSSAVVIKAPITTSPPPMSYVAPGVSGLSTAGEAKNLDAPPTDPTNTSFTPTNTKPLSNQVVPDQPKAIDTPTPPIDKPATPIGGLIGELEKPTAIPPEPRPNVAPNVKTVPKPEPPPVIHPPRIDRPAAPKRDLPANVTSSIGQKLVLIKPGHFLMGDEKLADATPHEVTLTKPFYMAAYELSNGELKKIVPQDQQPPGPAQPDDLPAAFITYDQAVDLCRRLSELPEEKAAGRSYRLPTEAEWEYACRAGTTTRYSFGNTITSEQANFGKKIDLTALRRNNENPPAERPDRPGPNGQRPNRPGQNGPGGGGAPNPQQERQQRPLDRVGSFTPNSWGLYDMHGSVWEWCSDFYSADYYKKSPAEDPTGPETGKTHVARGGAWNSTLASVTSAARNAKAEPEQRMPLYGLRVVCDVQPQN